MARVHAASLLMEHSQSSLPKTCACVQSLRGRPPTLRAMLRRVRRRLRAMALPSKPEEETELLLIHVE